jgi:hypothetical protein
MGAAGIERRYRNLCGEGRKWTALVCLVTI